MFRAATPGTLLSLVAAALLAVVTLNTPIIKSIYFLQATVSGGGGGNGSGSGNGVLGEAITLGTLGYCIGSTCTKPQLGYEFNPNKLLGIEYIPAKYTGLVIKGLTYTLVLHPVACVIAIAAFVFGLLAHCSAVGMGCLSACATGTAAAVALIAFGLDMALFMIAKKRIESLGNGASAQLGSALWLTIAAWALLVVAGCSFGCGMCGGGGGGGGGSRKSRRKDESMGGYGGYGAGDAYADRMRMDALDAEADRKRRQAEYDRNAADLPKFAEYVTEHEVPLKEDYDDSLAHHDAAGTPGLATPGMAGAGAHAPMLSQHYAQRSGYGADPYANGSGAPHHQGYPSYADVPGVGEGYGRRQQSQSQSGGYGHYAEPSYTPGVGPQPYRDGLDSAGGSAILAGAGAAAAHHYADQQQSQPHYAQPQAQYPEHSQSYNADSGAGAGYAPTRTPSAAAGGAARDYRDYRSPSAAPSHHSHSYSQSHGHNAYGPSHYDHAAPPMPQPYGSGSGSAMPMPAPAPAQEHQPHRRGTSRDSYGAGAQSANYGVARAPSAGPQQQQYRHNTASEDHAARAQADDFGLDAIVSPTRAGAGAVQGSGSALQAQPTGVTAYSTQAPSYATRADARYTAEPASYDATSPTGRAPLPPLPADHSHAGQYDQAYAPPPPSNDPPGYHSSGPGVYAGYNADQKR